MNFPYVIALLLTFAALTTYLNERFLKLPTTIALVLFSLGVSLLILLASRAALVWPQQARTFVRRIDFGETLMNGMLSYLLFAGSMHVRLDEWREHRWPIAICAAASLSRWLCRCLRIGSVRCS